jgi:phage portal protein BeeE
MAILLTNVFAQVKQNQQQQGQQMQQSLSQAKVDKTSSVLKDRPNLQDNFFEFDNITFSHHMVSVNGIQMHYVIGGHGIL